MTDERDVAPFDLTIEQMTALKRAVRNGEYHLLLGAGSSLDSINKFGENLPNSGELISQLSKTFQVPSEPGDLLWRIYDRAVEATGNTRVYDWLKKRFWGVKHPYWMEYYARSPWSTVWTLNIDDSFESAYRNISGETTRELETLNWDDPYRYGKKLNVIHLHGVLDTEEPRRLVFSLREYAGSAAERAAWPANFHDSYGNSPFVILGARMRDEPDIEAVVAGRQPSSSAPSFYVSRKISDAMRNDLLRWGLVPVQMTAEDFVLAWSELTGLDLETEFSTELELGIRIGQQFAELTTNNRAKKEPGHDFLGGDEPVWDDIQDGLAAELEWVTKATIDSKQIGKRLNNSSILAFTGRRLTGRSTGLLQIGHHFRKNSWRTFIFRHDGRIDTDALLAYAADGKSIALLFDGATDIADDLDRLTNDARATGCSIVSIIVDDINREANILGRVNQANLAFGRIANINGKLTKVDAARLIDSLARVGRLGFAEALNDSGRIKHFAGKELFDSMAQLENAPGFGSRVEQLTSTLHDDYKIHLLLLASYAAQVGRRLLVIDAGRMVGLNSDHLVRIIQVDDELSSLLATDGTNIRTRQRWMALKPLVKAIGTERSAHLLAESVRKVSSRLNQQSLRERNPTAMLIGSFMIQRNLKEAFPGANLDLWYSSLLDVFGSWSARYWEQRAILARQESRHDASLLAKAESFALRATQLVPDTYSYTTLGTIFMEKAANNQYDLFEYYRRAFEAFENAAKLDSAKANIVTWTAYLRSTIRVLARMTAHSSSTAESPEFEKLWFQIREDWVRIFTQLRLMSASSEELQADLIRLQSLYSKLPNAIDDSDVVQ